MKAFPAILLAASLLLTASCTHLQPALPANAKPDAQSAVLYGRFSIGHNFAFKNKLALWLEDERTRHPFYIYFDANQPVYGVRVQPGKYRVKGFAALNRTQELEGRQALSRMPRPFSVTAGSEAYIGDYAGEMKWDGMVSTWALKSWTNNFAVTTMEFRQQCPRLAMVPATSIFGGPSPIH